MDIQIIIVSLIVLIAAIYVGKITLAKVKSFSPKNKDCGSDCGCDSKLTNKP